MDDKAQSRLIIYGHNFCGQSRGLRRELDENHIDYEWRDVREGPAEYQDQLKKLAKGYLSVPTVLFPDGTVLVEPMPSEVMGKLKPPSQPQDSGILGRLLRR